VEYPKNLYFFNSVERANSQRTDRQVWSDTPVAVCCSLGRLNMLTIRIRMSEKWRGVIWWLSTLLCVCQCCV